jgi:hypothetical protein
MALETRSWFGCSLTMAIGFASVFGAGPARAASAGAIDSVQIFPRVAQVPDHANQTYQVLAFDSLGKKVALNGASVSWSLVPTKGCPAPAGSLRVQTQPASAVYAAPATGNAGKCPDALAVKVSSLGQSVSATASAAFFVNDPTMYTNLQGVLYDKTHSPSPYAELVLTGGGPGSVCQHCTIIADSNGAINAWVTRSREYFATIGLLTAGGGYATYVPDVALFWSHAAPQRIQDFVATSTLALGGSGTAKTAWEYFVRDSIKIWESTEGGTGSGQVSLASGGFQTTDLAYLLTHPTPGQSGRLASGEAGSGRSPSTPISGTLPAPRWCCTIPIAPRAVILRRST